jgi:polysaccharide deacetylase family protein (PEP-CTERM system associated)
MMRNAFTIDLEDWFCSHNLQSAVSYDDWDRLESRVVSTTHHVLELLDDFNVEATFFVLGWVADRFPDLISEINDRKHEIGTHGYAHRLITQMSPESFSEDLRRSIEVIQNITSKPVHGFRAPAFSIVHSTAWAVPVMKSLGITYDSSVYPISCHPDYGITDAPLTPYYHPQGIREIPLSCVEFGSYRIPSSGGAYFRMLPYPIYRSLINRLHRQGRPLIFYLHPWELDPKIPKLRLTSFAKFRHYTNLQFAKQKLVRLLTDFDFTSIRKLYTNHE